MPKKSNDILTLAKLRVDVGDCLTEARGLVGKVECLMRRMAFVHSQAVKINEFAQIQGAEHEGLKTDLSGLLARISALQTSVDAVRFVAKIPKRKARKARKLEKQARKSAG